MPMQVPMVALSCDIGTHPVGSYDSCFDVMDVSLGRVLCFDVSSEMVVAL